MIGPAPRLLDDARAQGAAKPGTAEATEGGVGQAPPRFERQIRIEAALRETEGNVSEAARALGVHRSQLRRWLQRYRIDLARFRPGGRPSRE